jgi:four helix bundle protein
VDRTAEDLKARTKRFAIAIFDFVETLPHTTGPSELARQLSRAALGVAGNYRSACRSRSHTEFTARIAIVLEEADEAELWLDISTEKQWGDAKRRTKLLDESGQLRAIFSKACTTARLREHRHR